jgi:hypothetical protein
MGRSELQDYPVWHQRENWGVNRQTEFNVTVEIRLEVLNMPVRMKFFRNSAHEKTDHSEVVLARLLPV